LIELNRGRTAVVRGLPVDELPLKRRPEAHDLLTWPKPKGPPESCGTTAVTAAMTATPLYTRGLARPPAEQMAAALAGCQGCARTF
jgi:hypothetical protein